jgi:SAM-dependent methyltransferase
MHNAPARERAAGRERSEAEFHDARVSEVKTTRLNFAYQSVYDVYRFTQVPEEKLSRRILEIGCFKGERAVRLRRMGGVSGEFIGIDISPASIEHCQGLELDPEHFKFRVDDANTLSSVADDSIEYAFGDGVLHHLDLNRFSEALSKKLSRTGVARFVEPAVGNVLLRAFRRVTPKMRTVDERPFDENAIEVLKKHFDLDIRYQSLLRPFIPMLCLNNPRVVSACRSLDDRLLKLTALQSQAWLLNIELRRRST